MNKLMPASMVLALALPFHVCAQTLPATPSELQVLRQEVEAMRAAYEARLQTLEQRLKAAEQASAAKAPTNSGPADLPSVAAPPSVAGTPAAPTASPSASASPSPAGGANAFNPAISLILAGGYSRTSQDPAKYRITGVPLPVDNAPGPGSRGFSLAESELGLPR